MLCLTRAYPNEAQLETHFPSQVGLFLIFETVDGRGLGPVRA
jgi:hypothetical protein